MCINPPFHQEPLDVMSIDDSGVLPGPPTSTALSIDTSNTSDTLPTSTMKPQVTTTVASSSQTIESSVDTPTKGASQASLTSLSSLSESNDDSKTTRFKVTSVETLSLDGEQGERREHANSEFEIMRVVTDLDNSTAHTRQPASADESLHISKVESGSEEDATSLSEASKIDSMASSDLTLSEPHPATAVQENLSDASSHVGNGSNVPPGLSRFKRVNMYERGRWTIKDMANTEESQKDPKNPQKLLQEGSAVSLLSPATSRKGALSEYSEPPFSTAGDLSSASGMLTDVSSEKDGSGSIIERSSTAAESTLSRRSSMSSLVPDDHFDAESVASASGSTVGRDRDTPEIAQSSSQPPVTQQPVPPSQPVPTTAAAPVTAPVTVVHTPLQATQVPPLMTQAPITQQVPVTTLPSVTVASSGVTTMAPTPVSTAQAREESYASGAVGTAHGANCTCEACTEAR